MPGRPDKINGRQPVRVSVKRCHRIETVTGGTVNGFDAAGHDAVTSLSLTGYRTETKVLGLHDEQRVGRPEALRPPGETVKIQSARV
jgi:hypothetical protein